MIYVDSSLVVKLYVPEKNSPAVVSFVESRKEPLVFTRHLSLEVQTAIRRRVFDRTLPADKAKQAIFHFNRDVGLSYVFNTPDLDMHRVYGRALGISREWADSLGVRTLDILHVASALELRLSEFATGDERQAQLAEKCGLTITRL
ncbi:MAG TPA: type II toxin-antitoxin system VapC family toxin [Opitutaceae bacterium]|jgi:predicted nucleic acid-binding protein|nr:type II toxin-antitoxin system VapC family toxin [Opitutaceae bacterium]